MKKPIETASHTQPDKGLTLTRRAFATGALAAPFAPTLARAQQTPFEKLALNASPDRAARILKGAKDEGVLTVYGSAPVDDMGQIFTAFESKYGVKVRYWRAGPQELIRRAQTEYKAGRFDVDVIQANGPTMEAIRRESIFQQVASALHAELLPQAVPQHREWVGERLNIIIGAYNTKAVKPEEAPSSYEGFADAKWSGKLAVEATDYDWLATIVSAMGEEKGVELFRRIGRTAGFSVRKGHTLITTLVAAGEIPVSLNVFSYKVEQLAKEGAPIAPLSISPAVGRVNGIGAARRPPHPNATLLYYEFMLSDGQRVLLERDFTPTNQKVQALPADMKLDFVDAAKLLDEEEKWTQLWKEITSLRPGK